LVVFGHGFDSVPGVYARLLDRWASAGYVVAAPTFPVENANARGGPDESDLSNQPADISFVISRLLAASAAGSGLARGLIEPTRIAVAGQSDGGETALAVAYDKPFLDRRVRAAIILSGAEIPGSPFQFTPASPPLLAAQGTADPINPPRYTQQFFRIAPRPKFLLTLKGAGHIQPYTTNTRQLAIVEDVTLAFLNCYLKRAPIGELLTADHTPAIATLTAKP
jgi:dienelactone hydrolase